MRDERLAEHILAVDTLAAVNVKPPAAWQALRQRLVAYKSMQFTAVDALVYTIVNDGPDIETRRAFALAEALAGQAAATVEPRVDTAVLYRLRDILSPHVRSNYAAVAAQFDAAAAELRAAATHVDLDAEPIDVLALPDKSRRAWSGASTVAAQLTRLIDPLIAAVELIGVQEVARDELQIPLMIDTANADRHPLWRAWYDRNTPRLGRWGGVLKADGVIRAHPNPTPWG